MSYRFAIVYKDELLQYSHHDKSILFHTVKKELQDRNIFTNDKELMASIERQSKSKKTVKKGLRLADAIMGAKALVRYTLGNSASVEEIHRRAKICQQCPLKDSVTDCMSCGGSAKVTLFLNKLRTQKRLETKIPDELRKKFCGMCGCSIPLLLVTKYEDFYQEHESKNSARPDFCWLKKTSTNFTKE